MKRLFAVLVGSALVAVVPAPAASAHAFGGCPATSGFYAAQFGDIPEIDQALFDHFDVNGDGTICVRPYADLPSKHVKEGGVAIDNTVRGAAAG